MKSAFMETRELALGYRVNGGDRRVASGLGLKLHPGELVCLVGENGIGKSTLLRTLAGLLSPLGGEILLQGRRLSDWEAREKARRLAVVLTVRVPGDRLSVSELVALGRHPHTDWLGRMCQEDREVVRDSLERVGGMALAERRVGTLSDGERQKVMIARALAQESQVLLLDEPISHLDLLRRVEILEILRQVAREEDRAVLVSIHDIPLALDFADRLWLMEAGGGFVEGAPEELVLDGTLARAFSTGEQVFDPFRRGYPLKRLPGRAVSVRGTGKPLYWTCQALSRKGFAVESDGRETLGQVTVIARGKRCRWELSEGGTFRSFDRLGDLLTVLEKRSSRSASAMK